jgi:hypothetical protein
MLAVPRSSVYARESAARCRVDAEAQQLRARGRPMNIAASHAPAPGRHRRHWQAYPSPHGRVGPGGPRVDAALPHDHQRPPPCALPQSGRWSRQHPARRSLGGRPHVRVPPARLRLLGCWVAYLTGLRLCRRSLSEPAEAFRRDIDALVRAYGVWCTCRCHRRRRPSPVAPMRTLTSAAHRTVPPGDLTC